MDKIENVDGLAFSRLPDGDGDGGDDGGVSVYVSREGVNLKAVTMWCGWGKVGKVKM